MNALLLTAMTIGCLHTLSGPDHYLPFVALARARKWSIYRTLFWTMLCGIGHVGSSVLLGLIGITLGWSLSELTWFENIRGGLAAWALLLFGLIYMMRGIYLAKINRVHKHFDWYDDGSIYVYEHKHGYAVHSKNRYPVTPWVLFFIFAMGPSEPMIPLLAYPAAKQSGFGIVILIIVYIFIILLTMMAMVALGYYGFNYLKAGKWERFVPAFSGFTILICGLGMVLLDW